MSISPTVGAIARLLDRIRFDHRYRVSKEKSQKLLNRLPLGKQVWRFGLLIESWLKDISRPTRFWENFGFGYIGPVDGHDFKKLEIALNRARNYTGGLIRFISTVSPALMELQKRKQSLLIAISLRRRC
jgi:1-deoxy-D-xylulose-5-phosphate synthase